MSGSVKYVVGAPPGPKSRGGVVTVLGGAIGPLWARARRGAMDTAPAARPTPVRSVRRDRSVSLGWPGTSDVMEILLGRDSRPAALSPPGGCGSSRDGPRIALQRRSVKGGLVAGGSARHARWRPAARRASRRAGPRNRAGLLDRREIRPVDS